MVTHFTFPFLAFSVSIEFKPNTLCTWLASARSVVAHAVAYYSQDFSGISVDHPSHAAMVSAVNMAFLPQSEVEIAFAGYYVTDDTCTVEKP